MAQKFPKTVFVTACNYGYLNHFHNFKCFVDRLGMKVLVIAMDGRTNAYLKTQNVSSVFYTGVEKVEEGSTEFRSKQFNIITNRKKAAVLSILRLGYDVVFSDVDVAIVRDPMPYFRWQNVDYMHSHNLICPRGDEWDFRTTEDEGNTGFYFVRSNVRTIKLWADCLANVTNYPELDDQSIFWIVLRGSVNPPVLPLRRCEDAANLTVTASNSLVTCPLDGCVFSAGALRGVAYVMLRDGLRKRNERVVSLHANYLKGNERKRSALELHGYWLASRAGGSDGGSAQWTGVCKPYVPKCVKSYVHDPGSTKCVVL